MQRTFVPSDFDKEPLENSMESHVEEAATFQNSPRELLGKIATYLTFRDMRQLLLSNKALCYDAIMKNNAVWKQFCFHRWPHLLGSELIFEADDEYQADDIHDGDSRPKYFQLLSQAASGQPPVNLHGAISSTTTPSLQFLSCSSFHYTGTHERHGHLHDGNFRRRRLKLSLRASRPMPRPSCGQREFVVPYVRANKIVLAPRPISYYEVSVLRPEPASKRRRSALPRMSATATAPELEREIIVGVGLATSESMLQHSCSNCGQIHNDSFMPGWDDQSYGYHGDDGKIFHGRGRGTHTGFPLYGPGNTVGCGVDHTQNKIFFTHNGKFLGHVWYYPPDGAALYPTVGVAAGSPVEVNFGNQKEFCFDIRSLAS